MLSDGGIDGYSLHIMFQLAGCIHIHPNLSDKISHIINGRNSRVSNISKLLWLGWGHTEIAHELSKTQGGCTVLALVAAFSSCDSDFEAAKGLIQLMRVCKCDPASLPSVDALKPTIAYLSPIVRDCGFQAVYNQIRAQCESALLESKWIDTAWIPAGCRGETSEWVQALRLIIQAHESGQHITLCALQRGFWLATFAALVLGMKVKILETSKEWSKPLWECAGATASLTICLKDMEPPSMLTLDTPLEIGAWQELPKRSLPTQFFQDTVTLHVRTLGRDVPHGPVHFSHEFASRLAVMAGFICGRYMLQRDILKDPKYDAQQQRTSFEISDPRQRTLFGPSKAQILIDTADRLSVPIEPFVHGLQSSRTNASAAAAMNIREPSEYGINDVAASIAATVIALGASNWDPQDCELCLLDTKSPSALEKRFRRIGGAKDLDTLREHSSVDLHYMPFLDHLSRLFCDLSTTTQSVSCGPTGELRIIATSSLNMSVYVTFLVDSACGLSPLQLFTVAKGRLSYEGRMRPYVTDLQISPSGALPRYHAEFFERPGLVPSYTNWPPGTSIKPHLAPGPVFLDVDVGLNDSDISISVTVCHRAKENRTQSGSARRCGLSLSHAIAELIKHRLCEPCAHDRDRSFDSHSDQSIVVRTASFGIVPKDETHVVCAL